MPRIDADRLLGDLRALRSFGASGTGVVRPALSPEDMQARRWLAMRFEAAGLSATIDGFGNLVGRSRHPGPALLIGSHSDTQPTGGWLDGALGVVYGLEVVRALAEDPRTCHLAVDVVSWQDEEGRFVDCLGSRACCGLLAVDALVGVSDHHGVSLDAAIEAAGLGREPIASLEPGRYRGFIEAHIEQGSRLEDAGQQIGVVTSIVGVSGRIFRFHGQQNHAGTTEMARRRDATTVLYDLAHAINQVFPTVASEHSVWTMGRVVVSPGSVSIVPGFAELELQYRDPSSAVLDDFDAAVERLVEEVGGRNAAAIEVLSVPTPVAPSVMDPELQELLAVAAEDHAPGQWMRMPSGAFHDASFVSAVLPAAMLFIPSIGGVSHDFAENSRDEDIVVGCRVLAHAAEMILTGARQRA